MTYEPRYYIEEALTATFNYFNDPIRAHKPVKANALICMPTGTGKSHFIAQFSKRAMQSFPSTRIFVSTHVKTLISQNAERMRESWPSAPIGINSAGLKQRDYIQPIIFGGVQSCIKKFPLFGRRDILIIDEAHLLADEGSYIKLIDEFTKGLPETNSNSPNINPYLKIIGLSATPYRMGMGSLTNGKIFTDIVYDITNLEGFNRLIVEGYLCTLIPKKTQVEFDTSKVGISAGDYNQKELQAAVDIDTVTYAALREAVELGKERHSWLCFASGIEHAEHIAKMLNNTFNIPTVCIHSKKSSEENDKSLKLWKTGKVRCAVNMNSLTTGIDHKPCDYIIMMRSTMSTGLWVQMLGRGTRPYDFTTEPNRVLSSNFPFVKQNCLVADFANNARRLGPINDPVIPRKKSEGPPGDAPIKLCKTTRNRATGLEEQGCGTWNHVTARVCFLCGKEFPTIEHINKEASTLELVRSDLPQIETFYVDRVVMLPHKSIHSQRSSIKIAYYCGLRTFFEYKSVESTVPLMRHKGRDWFRQRYHYNTKPEHWENDCPVSDSEVIALNGELRQPTAIKVWVNKQNPEIMSYEF